MTDPAESRLTELSERYRRSHTESRVHYRELFDAIREANADGLSYDRIAKITELSKTQVQRICGK